MPDKRKHRGAHPEDGRLFAQVFWPPLRQAVNNLSWLLSRGYADKSALKLVGDRFDLTQRQRNAVMRSACADQARQVRKNKQLEADKLVGEPLRLDGYNIITTIETALAGGIIFRGRDGCLRDIASMHGTYRKVQETIPGLKMVGAYLADKQPTECIWYLDSPVSNSGRLKTIILQVAGEHGWNWQVELVHNPDKVLIETSDIIASSDSEVLNRCNRWFNLTAELIAESIPQAHLVDLSLENDSPQGSCKDG